MLLGAGTGGCLTLPTGIATLATNGGVPPTFMSARGATDSGFSTRCTDFGLTRRADIRATTGVGTGGLYCRANVSVVGSTRIVFVGRPRVLAGFIFGGLLSLVGPPITKVGKAVGRTIAGSIVTGTAVLTRGSNRPTRGITISIGNSFSGRLTRKRCRVAINTINCMSRIFSVSLGLANLGALGIRLIGVIWFGWVVLGGNTPGTRFF